MKPFKREFQATAWPNVCMVNNSQVTQGQETGVWIVCDCCWSTKTIRF